MTFTQIIRLLMRFAPYMLITALLLAGTVAFFSLQNKKEYKSHTLLNTGLISGYNIESSKGSRIDYAYTNNEMENLVNLATSLETNRELSANLIADIAWEVKGGKSPLLGENSSEIEKLMEELVAAGIQVDKLSKQGLLDRIIDTRDSSKDNPIYELVNSKNPLFGIETLENIKVFREGNSDMIRMEYTSIDPYLSKKTLELLTALFMDKQKNIKQGQSDTVIQFFEEATQKTLDRLQGAEDELLKFRVKNQIINYYEQTRFIAGNREELEKKYQEQLQIQAGSLSSLKRLEEEMGDKQVLAKMQNKISDNQDQIADYNFALMELKLLSDNQQSPGNIGLQQELEDKIATLRNEMIEDTYGVVDHNHTTDGVPTSNILTQWLGAVITHEESSAQIQVMENRMKEYDGIYDRFAPLGSTLRRLESEIDVAEREYLENLHSYNQARLHKYNMMMSTNLKVIDFPYYPSQPEKSKTLMMVVLSFIVGLILPAATVIGMEVIDASLKSPKNASAQTGLKLAGIMPLYPKDEKKHPVDFSLLTRQAMNLFLQEVEVSSPREGKTRVAVISVHEGEGKSTLIKSAESFIEHHYPEAKGKFEWIEYPSLMGHPYGRKEKAPCDTHLMVASANRKWTEADQHALKVYKRFIGKKPLLVLNRVRTDIMEDVTGEVPRRRTWLRSKVKSILS